MTTGIDLFSLDVLPPRCSVESIIGFGPGGELTARFRAERRVWRRWRLVREHSDERRDAAWLELTDAEALRLIERLAATLGAI